MQHAVRSGAPIRHMYHWKTMVLLATHSWWWNSVTLLLGLSGVEWSWYPPYSILETYFCFFCFFLCCFSFCFGNEVIHSFIHSKRHLCEAGDPHFVSGETVALSPCGSLTSLHLLLELIGKYFFFLYNTGLCVFKPTQSYKGQCCHCPLLSLHFESKQKPKYIDIHVEVVCSLATRLREITSRDRKTLGSQQNATWRSHSWLWKCYNIKHLLALGAALHTDCHVQNATDALEGFERLEKCPDGFFFPWEEMDVPAGLNLHMHTAVPRPADKVSDKMAESRMLFRMGVFWSAAV